MIEGYPPRSCCVWRHGSVEAFEKMTGINVRNLNRTDASAWASLRYSALRDHPLAFGRPPPDDVNELEATFIERIDDDEAVVFGAFEAAELVGMAGVRRMPGVKERHKAMLWGMYVSPSSRRQGVGDLLLGSAIKEASSWAGVLQLHLAVSDSALAAALLYEKHGFETWGIEPRALNWQGKFVDEKHMVRYLKTD